MARVGKRVILNKRCEEILRVVYFYRYMTALDVTSLLFSPGSLTHVRSLLSLLCRGGDFLAHEYLYRFSLPSVSVGNTEKVYTLGSLGRDFLERELGIAVDWHYRLGKVKHLSFVKVLHNLCLTRVLVAANRWARTDPFFSLVKTRICYELAGEGASFAVDAEERGGREKITVVPDGWLLFERRRGEEVNTLPALLEIDRGTAYSWNFKRHVKARMEYVKRGREYSRIFGTEIVRVAYVTTGESPEYRETRRKAMCSWTREVLKEMKRERWAPVFRFHALSFGEIYESGIFEKEVWYRPDEEKPVGLFAD